MRRQFIIGALIIAAAFAAGALLIWSRPEPEKKPEDERAPLVQVEPVEIRNGKLTINGSGTVRAAEEVNLAAEVAGKLVYVNPSLREGQNIGNGAVLFRIDPTDYRNAVQSAQADIAARRVDVLQAREEMTIARAELDQFARRSANSGTKLYADVDENDYAARILPPENLTRQSSTDGSNGKASTETNGLATREPQLRSARAGLQRAQAQLADANSALRRTTVRAPFAGIVRSEQIAKGSYVAPGQTLGSIVNSNSFEAVIPLSEKEASLIPSLFTGGRIEASVFFEYGGSKYRWQAFVDRASNVLNPQTRTIDLFLRIPNPLRGGVPAALKKGGQSIGARASKAPPLLIGSFVEAWIDGMELAEYASIPLAALRPGNQVWLVEAGRVKVVDIEILQRTDTEVLIRSDGLGTNPKAITGGLPTAIAGQKVRVPEKKKRKSPAKAKKTKVATK
ncbi:MAG: HlyD family efflux transporter periplasmic adaptor subunit [Parasphingorhabdus sp.]